MHVADLSGTVCASYLSNRTSWPPIPRSCDSQRIRLQASKKICARMFEISGGKFRRWLNGQATGPARHLILTRPYRRRCGEAERCRMPNRRDGSLAVADLKRGCKDQGHELLHGHRSRDHADEVPVAADIDQTDTEAPVSIKEQMMMFLVYRRWRVESVSLQEHAYHPA